MRLVSTDRLTPDMVLAKGIYKGDLLYLTAGQNDLAKFVNGLNRLGIEYLYVEDEASEGIEIPDAVTAQTRKKCKDTLMRTMTDFSKNGSVDIDHLLVSAQLLLDEILENKEVQLSLTDISAADDYTFSHSVSATVYALLIAEGMNYSRDMMQKLAIGTLLHDIGKTLLDSDILFKNGLLTSEEFEYIKQHTTWGYEALKKCSSITELSRIISLTHHERLNGTGYPSGLSGSQLHEFARIVAVADVYDALTADRCYREKWPAQKALNFLIENSDTQFDTQMVALLIRRIAVYPNGSMVKMSDGCIGLVKEQNNGVPERPVVRIIYDRLGTRVKPYDVDLLVQLDQVIVESQT